MSNTVLTALGKDALTVNALREATGLSATDLTLELVKLGKKVKLGADGRTVTAVRRGRPAGRSPVVNARVEIAKAKIIELRGTGCSVQDVVVALEADGIASRDVKAAGEELAEAGEITRTRQGRKLIFTKRIDMSA